MLDGIGKFVASAWSDVALETNRDRLGLETMSPVEVSLSESGGDLKHVIDVGMAAQQDNSRGRNGLDDAHHTKSKRP